MFVGLQPQRYGERLAGHCGGLRGDQLDPDVVALDNFGAQRQCDGGQYCCEQHWKDEAKGLQHGAMTGHGLGGFRPARHPR